MIRSRYMHRVVVYKNRYLINIGGDADDTKRPYTFVEYTDVVTNRAQVGTIVNPDNGPSSLQTGCAHLVGDVILYLGGWEGTENALAPFLNLLQVQPQMDGTLQFKWVTGTPSPLPSENESSSPSGSASAPGSDSASRGVGIGAIAGIVVGVVLVSTVFGFFVVRWRSRSQKGTGADSKQVEKEEMDAVSPRMG
ncbi:hypothetical protein GGF32_001691 [Allomyces javanicus]|nr:hypothetical protein GGF32_001691 [Allomyces javanicus]